MTIEQARENIGRRVTYNPGWEELIEYGVITSVNDVFVFVRYGNDINSKATNPELLKLSEGK